ncbi:hypothetical protein GCM10017688_17810 [Streptomyces ramulosus]
MAAPSLPPQAVRLRARAAVAAASTVVRIREVRDMRMVFPLCSCGTSLRRSRGVDTTFAGVPDVLETSHSRLVDDRARAGGDAETGSAAARAALTGRQLVSTRTTTK